MAGRVPAHIMIGDGLSTYWVEPSVCPVADEHRRDAADVEPGLAPRCLSHDPLIGRRTCPYWYALTTIDNAADRTDASLMAGVAAQAGRRQLRCGVLCMAQRRNRPPGV
jgi:hypothetical protein